jgi:putative phosphoesterase
LKIGVLADTHGRFDTRLETLFSGCDHIIHAGDIGRASVLRRLEEMAPVTAVLGNVDYLEMADLLPEVAELRLGGCRFLVTHLLGEPHAPVAPIRRRLEEAPADVVVYGHSHRAYNAWVGGTLFFNPGSAGPRRFTLPQTAGLLTVSANGEIVARIYDLNEEPVVQTG